MKKQEAAVAGAAKGIDPTRRGFVAAAGAAAGAVLVGAHVAAADEGVADGGQPAWDYKCDVVVAGSGNGGMSAAVTAQDAGVSCIVVEISGTTGGGTGFSGGMIHAGGAIDVDSYDTVTEGLTDPELGHAYIAGYNEYFQWLNSIGAPITPEGYTPTADAPWGYMDGTRKFFDFMVDHFEAAGGTVLTKTAAHDVIMGDDGKVAGLRCLDADGKAVRIGAKAVVLACGGFQGNSELRDRYLGREADAATVVGTPYNQGAGMRMALAAGASLQGSMGSFSCGWIPALPARNPMEDVEEYESRGYDEDADPSKTKSGMTKSVLFGLPAGHILVNLDGKRFINESETAGRVPEAVARQRRATAVVVCDAEVWDSLKNWFSPEAAEELGGTILEADTLEDLASQLSQITPNQVHAKNFLGTISEYNEAVESGKLEEVWPSVTPSDGLAPIATPPFYAYPVRPGIYCCYGGVAIDAKSQVLDINRQPIAGLYAATPTAGGIAREIYTGGIAQAGVTGRAAGASAAEYAGK